MDAAGTVAEINARLREVLSEVEMDTLPDARVKMTATLADRGERVPYVDQDGDPLFDVEPDFMPDHSTNTPAGGCAAAACAPCRNGRAFPGVE